MKGDPDVTKWWLGLRLLCLILDLADDGCRVAHNEDPLHMKFLSIIDNAYPVALSSAFEIEGSKESGAPSRHKSTL